MDKKKILLADDERDLVTMLSMRLEANDYRIITAYDGQEAFKLAREEKPDLVLLDILMPVMDGLKVCKKLKYDPLTAGIPVIMLTAKGRPEDIKLAKQAGADEYIIKPFEDQLLLFNIQHLLSRVNRG